LQLVHDITCRQGGWEVVAAEQSFYDGLTVAAKNRYVLPGKDEPGEAAARPRHGGLPDCQPNLQSAPDQRK
jgi:hypothetical protein